MRNICKTQGFSLIEMLIVVAIIGILAAIAVPRLAAARAAAQQGAATATLRTMLNTQFSLMVSLGRYGRISELNQFHNGNLGEMVGPTLRRQSYVFQTIPTAPTDAQLTNSFRIAATGQGSDGVTPVIFLLNESGIISQVSP